MSEEKKPMFGITKETKDSNVVVISTPKKIAEATKEFPNGYVFPICRLVSVVSNPSLAKKNGETTAVLQFVFKTDTKEQFTHTEWELETTDSKFEDKVGYMNVRIKHIYTSIFGAFPEEGIGSNAKNFVEFFNAVKEAFDSKIVEIPSKEEGKEPKKVPFYFTVYLYIKLTYYKANLKFPLAPNFLEPVGKAKVCKTLTVNLAYDDLEPTKKTNPNAAGGGGLGSPSMDTDLPDFDADFS